MRFTQTISLLLTAFLAQAQTTAPIGVTRLDSGGLRLLHGPAAFYPDAARAAGIEGTVGVDANLDAKGHVIDAQTVSGPPELRAAALKSILDDHFAPDAGFPRKVHLRVVFTLDRAPGHTRPIGGLPPVSINPDEPPQPIAAIDCFVPPDLCRDVNQRLSAYTGSPLTVETRDQIQKDLEALDDHLLARPRKTPKGWALTVVLSVPLPTDAMVPGGVIGGLAGGVGGGVFPIGSPAPPPPPPPPLRTPEGKPQRISVAESVQKAKLIRQPRPVYPAEAKADRIQGAVRLSGIIGKDGSVLNLQVISGHPLLIPAALEAVKQWKWLPTAVNGEPVEVATQITVTFTLLSQ